MIDLLATEHEALKRVVAAGPVGLRLDVVTASMAIRLSLDGLVTITKDRPQRAVATPQGAAFLRRGVHA